MLPKIQTLLSGKNPIKITPKGTRYKFYQVKRRHRGAFSGTGYVYFFYDYGSKACVRKVKYHSVGGQHQIRQVITYWFKIIGDRVVISVNTNGNYRIISNAIHKIDLSARYRNNGSEKRLQKFLLKWAAKNGIKIKKKWHKYSFTKVCYLLCYPESEYFFDFAKSTIIPEKIPSIISSNLRGIKGLNHGLDRLCGFHGKKLKILLQDNYIFDKLAFCRALKKLVTSDDITKILENYISQPSVYIDFSSKSKLARYFLKNYHRDTIIKWLNGFPTELSLFMDSAQMYYKHNKDFPNNKIQLPDSNDLTEIHNYITRECRKVEILRLHKDVDFPKRNEKYIQFETELDNLRIELPKTPQNLINASTILSNCLSSYIDFHHKHGLILLIFKDNILTYAVSLRGYKDNFKLEQFYGKYNQPPDSEDKKKIESFLSQYVNIINN